VAIINRPPRHRPFWLPAETSLIEGVRWLIQLRWLAIAGVIGALLAGIYLFHLPLFWQGILVVSLFLALLNLVYYLILQRRYKGREKDPDALNRAVFFAHLQIFLDLFLLTLLLYFAGGPLNPFNFFYIFHIIITSILISRRDSYLQSAWAVILFISLVLLTASGKVDYFPLYPGLDHRLFLGPRQILLIIGAFSITIFIAAFLTNSIMETLRRREEELARAYEEVAKREKIKSEFARTVAHELKSPMSAIMSFIHAVKLTEQDKLSDKAQDFLDRALKRGQGLVDLIRDLLELSQLESSDAPKPEELEDIDLISELELVVSVEKTSAESKGITTYFTHPPVLPKLRYSRAAIQQIFTNLISNAVRYTPAGGTVRVELSRKNNKLKCTISDTGIGIPKDSMGKLFTDFYRAPNAKQFSPTGTGLGLAITKALIELYGGSIFVESEEGKGTTFTVYFYL
jgi:signal transduction histidine kinase